MKHYFNNNNNNKKIKMFADLYFGFILSARALDAWAAASSQRVSIQSMGALEAKSCLEYDAEILKKISKILKSWE